MPAWTLPHTRDGLRVRLMAVLRPCRRPSICRHVHRQFLRNALARLHSYHTHNYLLPKKLRRDGSVLKVEMTA